MCNSEGNIKCVAVVKNNMVVPLKIINRITVCSSNSTSGMYQKELKTETEISICTLMLIAIYNSQKVESTQLTIERWMDKQNLVLKYNGILFGHEKEGNSDTTWMNLEDYAKWNKQITKRQILDNFTCLKWLKW